ncbi:MAG: hypothetical protein QXK37_02840 [Candidatus Woesearchaeota archaeon]
MVKRGASTGIGFLIILISVLTVASIAAYVLFFSTTPLQEESLNTAEGAKSQVTTLVELVDLSAEDGRDGSVDDFRYIVKLKPGAQPIKLSDVVIYMNTYNDTLRLIYRPGRCVKNQTMGYYTIK